MANTVEEALVELKLKICEVIENMNNLSVSVMYQSKKIDSINELLDFHKLNVIQK